MSRHKINFNDSTIRTLIEEVKQRPCLWYMEHENYNDRCSVATAWEEISEKMQMEERLLRLKWKTTRDMFRREAKRCKVADVESYSGKWRYFGILWFLHRPEYSKSEETDTDDCEIIDGSTESRNIKCETKDNIDSNANEDPDSDPFPDSQIRIDSDNDYDLMFLKSLSPYLRELDPIRRLVVRNKIQDIILNEIAAQEVAKKKHLF